MGLSDLIAGFINDVIEDTGGCAELQRAEIAQRFGCVPSQINYVISTRFSPEHGYMVESRRGGGGYIRITRVSMDCRELLARIIGAIGEEIDPATTRAFLSNLLESGVIEPYTAELMAAATGENALRVVPVPYRDTVRASVLKQMLINAIHIEDD